MAERARFLLVTGRRTGGRTSPAWPSARDPDDEGADGPWVAWRLLGRNNRELARSARVHPGPTEAIAAAVLMATRVADLVSSTVVDLASGEWGWRLELDGRPVAVSSRTYQRQRECHYSLTQLLAYVPQAQVPAPRADGAATTGPVALPQQARRPEEPRVRARP